MKRIFGALLSVFLLIGCQTSTNTIETITGQQAYERLQKEPDAIIIDVRRVDEYQSGHIPGAINIPLDELESAQLPDKEETIYLYCRTGNRSGKAAKILADMGYEHIVDFGGIQSWPGEVE